jgi:hypothetical protein
MAPGWARILNGVTVIKRKKADKSQGIVVFKMGSWFKKREMCSQSPCFCFESLINFVN